MGDRRVQKSLATTVHTCSQQALTARNARKVKLTRLMPVARALLYPRFRKVLLPATRRAFNSSSPPVHPFFQKKQHTAEEPGPFKWLPSLGPKQTCLHAVYLDPPSRTKVAAFDLDGTIIKGDVRNQTTNWQWWSPVVPKKIREVHDAG